MDLTRISIVCFTASYAVALVLEVASLARRFGWHRAVMLGFLFAGVFAHGAYLAIRAGGEAIPLSSPAEWCLLSALALASVCLFAAFAAPRTATGLFLLPLVLALVGASALASDEPIAPRSASVFWSRTHALLLVVATVTVVVGFLAGVMYLIQSWRLKHKLPPSSALRLPSLEQLERVNARALGLSALFVAGGFVSGLVLASLRSAGDGRSIWLDPLVISLTVMLAWLIAAEAFRLVYPAARRGRKVAYLTVASFVFLVITLASMTLGGGAHGAPQPASGAAASPVPASAEVPAVLTPPLPREARLEARAAPR